MQTGLMIAIAGLCILSAFDWAAQDQFASAFTFLGFGLGYIGLAFLFGG